MGRSRLRQGALLPLCATLFLTPALRAQQYHLTPLPPVVIQQPFSAPASGLTVTAPATTSPGSITFTAKKVTPAPDLPRNAGPFTLTLTAPDPLHVASITAATGQYSIYTLSQLETFTLASQASNFQFLGLNVYQGPLGANIPLPACNFSIVNSQTNKCVVNSLYAPTGTDGIVALDVLITFIFPGNLAIESNTLGVQFQWSVGCPSAALVPGGGREAAFTCAADGIKMTLAYPFPSDPISVASDLLPAFCAYGTYTYSGPNKAHIYLQLTDDKGHVVGSSPARDLPAGTNVPWGGDCTDIRTFFLILEQPMPILNIPSNAKPDDVVGHVILTAFLVDSGTGAPIGQSVPPATYNLIPKAVVQSGTPSLFVRVRDDDTLNSSDYGLNPDRLSLAATGETIESTILGAAGYTDDRTVTNFLGLNMQIALSASHGIVDLFGTRTDQVGNTLPLALTASPVAIVMGQNDVDLFPHGLVPAGTASVTLHPRVILPNGQRAVLTPLVLTLDSLKITSITPDPQADCKKSPDLCYKAGFANPFQAVIAVSSTKPGATLVRVFSQTFDYPGMTLPVVIPAGSTSFIQDDFLTPKVTDPAGVAELTYRLVPAGGLLSGCNCAQETVNYTAFTPPAPMNLLAGVKTTAAFVNGQVANAVSKTARTINNVQSSKGEHVTLGSIAKDFGFNYAVPAPNTGAKMFTPKAVASTPPFVGISTTWNFDPPIARDGSFSSSISFNYAASELPDDPNFVESKLQIISIDSAGALHVYPTTLDVANKTATATIDSLDPTYSLAVIGPFPSLPLFLASGRTGYALVNTGSQSANATASSYSASGSKRTVSAVLPSGHVQQSIGAAWQEGWVDSTAVTGASWLDNGAQFAVTPAMAPDSLFLIPDIESDTHMSTQIDVANTTAFPSTIAINLFGPDGSSKGVYTSTLDAKGSLSARAQDLFPGLTSPFSGYAVISSAQTLAASGIQWTGAAAAGIMAQPINAASFASTSLFAPQLAGAGAATTLHLVNTGSGTAHVTLKAWSASGSAASANVAVALASGQQFAQSIAGLFNLDPATLGSLEVDTDVAGVFGDVFTADSAVYANSAYSFALVGQAQTSWVLPYAPSKTTVNVFNPGTGGASITVAPYGSDGSSGLPTTTFVPAHGRAAITVNASGFVTVLSTLPVIASATVNSTVGILGGYNAVAAPVTLSAGFGKLPQVNTGGVVNAASFGSKLVRGGLATIFGANLSTGTGSASTLPLPTILAGASLTVGGIPAPLVYVSPGQINFQVPVEVPAGSAANLVITNSGTSSPTISVAMADYAVGVFTYARGSSVDPIIVHGATNQLVTPTSPATPNEALVVYATGVGKLSNPPLSGVAAPGGPLASAVDKPTITVGGSAATVIFAGLTPGLVGLVQFNIQLPASLPSGSLPLVIQFPGDSSVPVGLAVQGNVSGSPKLSLSSTSLAFGNVSAGQTKDLSVLVTNTGSTALNVTAVAVAGTGFSLTTPSSFPVQTGASQTVTVRFAPASAVQASGTLAIASNDPASPVIISLSGTGVAATAPAISLSPTSLDFGTVAPGQTKDLVLIVRNNGNAQLTVASGTIPNARFTTTNPGFPFNVGAGSFQNLVVRFSPTSTGAQSGLLTLATNDPANSSLGVSLVGNTAAPVSQDVTLQVDGGTYAKVFGFSNGQKGAIFVNRLTPASYPATLKSVQIYFGARTNGLASGTPITLLYGGSPSGSANFSTTFSTAATQVLQTGVFGTYTISNPLTITSGDFIVGFQVDNPAGIFPADLDSTTPSQQRSYYATPGSNFVLLDTIPSSAGNLAIRALVTLGP